MLMVISLAKGAYSALSMAYTLANKADKKAKHTLTKPERIDCNKKVLGIYVRVSLLGKVQLSDLISDNKKIVILKNYNYSTKNPTKYEMCGH